MNTTDFYTAVLEKLQVVGQGQTATAADRLKVQQAYAGFLDILTDEDLADWSESDDLPQWSERIMVPMVAALLTTEFGCDAQLTAQIVAEGGWNLPQTSVAERQLRRHQAAVYISTPARPDCF